MVQNLESPRLSGRVDSPVHVCEAETCEHPGNNNAMKTSERKGIHCCYSILPPLSDNHCLHVGRYKTRTRLDRITKFVSEQLGSITCKPR